MNPIYRPRCAALASLMLALLSIKATAQPVTDVVQHWNLKTSELIAEARIGTPPAVRVMALVQTAAGEAVELLAQPSAAALDAAVAAAHRATLLKLLPAQATAIDAAYQATLATVAEGSARSQGVAAGEKAAAQVLAARAGDVPGGDSYRPHTTPGQYVPTATPVALGWPQRKPWLMHTPAQFRPPPPPALDSEAWARNLNEVKQYGGRSSSVRTAEQADVARFWEFSLPAIYFGAVHSVARQPGRSVAQNARLFASVSQAMDDAMIAVFDAKYAHHFWRPATAIRNADLDGNAATVREEGWSPLIEVPMHPEYPSGHGILAGAVGAVLKSELGRGPSPELSTSSPSLKGAVRRWKDVDAFVQEIGDARVWGGLHYRFSTETAAEMGRRIGELAVARRLASAQ